MRTIRASEINSFLYCQRAWWLHKQGETPDNLAELKSGQQLHIQHGRTVLKLGILRASAYLLIFLSIILSTLYISSRIF